MVFRNISNLIFTLQNGRVEVLFVWSMVSKIVFLRTKKTDIGILNALFCKGIGYDLYLIKNLEWKLLHVFSKWSNSAKFLLLRTKHNQVHWMKGSQIWCSSPGCCKWMGIVIVGLNVKCGKCVNLEKFGNNGQLCLLQIMMLNLK